MSSPSSPTASLPVYDAVKQVHIIEQDVRLSESRLWSLQAQYYSELGIDAFQKVPFYGTGNATIGQVYAELILGTLLDLKDSLNTNEPIYILELGGGSGRLAQYILKTLLAHRSEFPLLDNVRYILSDATPSMLDYWLSQAVFEPLTSTGKLDFAVFNPLEHTSFTTHFQKQLIQGDTVKNPLITVATYFFDTLPHDAFYIDNHQLNEMVISLTRDAKKYDLDTPIRTSQLQRHERNRPAQLPYFNQPALDTVLSSYCRDLDKLPVVIPTFGLQALENLQQLTPKELVFITSDKGYGNPKAEAADQVMNIMLHGDAFSMRVNFDAVARYVDHYQGNSLFSTAPSSDVKTFLAVLPKSGTTPSSLSMTRYWFQKNMIDQDTVNHALNLQYLFVSDYTTNLNAKFDVFTALVSLSNYDPRMFSKAFEAIRPMETFTPQQADILTQLLERVEANIAGNSEYDDVFFELILLHRRLGHIEQTNQSYAHAVRLAGVNYNLAFLLGSMYQEMGEVKAALPFYQQAYDALSTENTPETQAIASQVKQLIQSIQV